MKKSCVYEAEILKALKENVINENLRGHLEECLLCQETRKLFLIMNKVRNNTKQSLGFINKKLQDPKLLLNIVQLENKPDYIYKEKVSMLLRIPRLITLILLSFCLTGILGFGEVRERLFGMIGNWKVALNGVERFLIIIPLSLIPIIIFLAYWVVSVFLNNREYRNRIKIH